MNVPTMEDTVIFHVIIAALGIINTKFRGEINGLNDLIIDMVLQQSEFKEHKETMDKLKADLSHKLRDYFIKTLPELYIKSMENICKEPTLIDELGDVCLIDGPDKQEMIETIIDHYKYSFLFDDFAGFIFKYPTLNWFSNNKDIQYDILNHLSTSHKDIDNKEIRSLCDIWFKVDNTKHPTGSSFCYDLLSDTVRSEIITKSGRKITPEDIYKMKPLLERNTYRPRAFFATNITIGLMLYLIYIICKFIFSYSTRRRLQPNPRVEVVLDGRRKKRRIKSIDKKSRYKSKRRLKSIQKRRKSKKY